MTTVVDRAPVARPAREPASAAPLGHAWAARLGLAILVALLALATRWPELDRYVTIDESRWVGRAADFATYLAERDLDKTFIVGHPGVTTMWLGGLGMGPDRVQEFSYLEGQTDVTRRPGYLEALVAARQAPLLLNALLLGLMVWLTWGLLGPGPAALGGLLLVADPFLAAHSRLLHLDALLTSFVMVAALAWFAFWQRGGWPYAVLAALASGLAFLTKAPSVYLLALLPAVAGLELVRSGRWRSAAGWLRLLGALAIWIGLAAAVCLALWPALRVRGLAVLRQMVEFTVSNGSGERDNYFLGRPIEDPGALFYPLALLFRATPLVVLGLALLVWFGLRRDRRQGVWRWPALLLAGYALGFLVMMTLGQKKFDRYALPAVPALDLLAGFGLWLGATAVLQARRLALVRAAVGGGLLALLVWPLASVYPYHLAYYNPLLGGGQAARWAVFVGWGEGLDRAAAYLNDKPIVLEAPTVASAYHRVLQAHLIGNGAMPLERAELADYIVPYVNGLQRGEEAALLDELLAGQEPEQIVWLNGIEYARIYRGPHLAVERALGVEFEGRLRLESIVLAPGSGRTRPGQEVHLRLRWRPRSGAEGLVSRVRLRDAAGNSVLESRQPLSAALREQDLLIGETRLKLPARLAQGEYTLVALLEDQAQSRTLASEAGSEAPLWRLSVGPAARE